MFIKLNRSGGRIYAQLAQAFRDEAGKPRNRVVATLGRIDQLDTSVDSILQGLLRATGRAAAGPVPSVEFESSLSFGDVWTLQSLWDQLGLHELDRVFRSGRRGTRSELLLRLMVFNRLCDPSSKLGVLRWLQTVSMPGVSVDEITHTQLLRAMDDWVELEPKILARLAKLLRPLVDTELSVVFYDVTTIGVCGHTELPGDVRAYGRSKNDTVERQFALGLVQTADGLPIAYEVFEGNVAETTTLMPMVERVLERFAVSRVVLVADRGLLSMDNLEKLQSVTLPSGRPLEFILAVPARRYVEFAPIIQDMGPPAAEGASTWVDERDWASEEGPTLRLVVAHDPVQAEVATQRRMSKLAELQALAQQWSGKLDEQDAGRRGRGRRLSDCGAKARLYHAVAQERLSSVMRVDLKSELFSYDIDEQVLQRLRTLDGKLVVLTNVRDLDAASIIERYRSLADIERGFRVLKSEIEIGPVFHRLPERIRAHAGICFMALVMYRVMRMRLRAAKADYSPSSALEMLARIQHHRIALNGARPVTGLSRVDELQARLLKALNVPQPQAANTRSEQFELPL